MPKESVPKTIAAGDGSMYVSTIGPDRRLDANSQPQASAVVMIKTGSGNFARTTRTEEDLLKTAETGTAEQKSFANQAIAAIHKYEQSGGSLTIEKEVQRFDRPAFAEPAAPVQPQTPSTSVAAMPTPAAP